MKLLASSLWLALGLAAASAAPPNVVILFSDDGGFADVGFQPNCKPDLKELTPNIDRVADDDDANELLARNYREPWQHPGI